MQRFAVMAFGLVLLGASPAQAKDALSINATLSDTQVPIGDVVTLEVRTVSKVDGQVELQIPQVQGLSELSRSQSEGTSISWTSAGQSVTREHTLTIEYQTDRAGKIAIPAIVARVGKHRASSTPLMVVVGEVELPPDAATPQAGEVTPPTASETQVFVRYRLDKSEAYLGEQVVLDCEIFASPRYQFTVEKADPPPTFDGFWQEVLDRPQRLDRRVEQVAGKTYHVYRLWRVALFGLEAGELTISPSSITFSQGRTIFGSGRRTRRRTLPIQVTVKPLPTKGRPADFSNNNVGQYLLSASLDHDRVPAGKAVMLSLSLSGVGNVKSARLPEVKAIDGFRVFPPTVTDDIKVTADGVRGTKTAQILLMPERGGRLEIPAFNLATFEPETGSYASRRTETMRVIVDGTPSVTTQTSPPTAGDKTSHAGLDLEPLRYRSNLAKSPTVSWRSPLFVGGFAAPWVLFGFFIVGRRVIRRASTETAATKKKRATELARMQLVEAKAALDGGDLAAAYAKFSEALTQYGTEKCGIPLRGQTADGVRAALSERGATAELAGQVADELEAADYARFAPGTLGGADASAAYERWSAIFQELEAFETNGGRS